MEENNEEKSANHVYDTEVISFDIAIRNSYELDLKGKFDVVLREGKYYVERIKPQYPKTYEECCEVLFPNSIELGKVLTSGYNCELLKKLGKLLICRDAYWKIAGKQMGLDKPWQPSKYEMVYSFYRNLDRIVTHPSSGECGIFEFPTEEMRDAFYENFKDLIEACKELL